MKVYLAGPIAGYSYGEINDWRVSVKDELKNHGIDGYSPMRGKEYLSDEKILKDPYNEKSRRSAEITTGINVRDYNDCKTADAILVNFLGSNKISIGTCMEVAWARAFQIPLVMIMEKDNIHSHCMLTFGNIIVSDIQEGVDTIIQILKA